MTVEPEPRSLAADLPSRLDELMLQTLSILKADTCAILLLDDERRFLTVRAAKGFDAEIERAVPIPFGEGMAGHVVASGKPVLIDDLSGVELASPHLRERGITSLVAIPIVIEDRVIGVAHSRCNRCFTDDFGTGAPSSSSTFEWISMYRRRPPASARTARTAALTVPNFSFPSRD